VVAVVLIPWTAWLAVRLPSTHLSPHWDVAWVGFDIGLTVTIGATAIALWRRAKVAPFLATVGGTLLVTDAWFDIVTSRPGDELRFAVALATAAEVPLAALCFWMVRRWVPRRPSARGEPAIPPQIQPLGGGSARLSPSDDAARLP
jgi:hypothetical protein